MPRQSFETIRDSLDAALEFCRSLGLSPDASRFTEYRNRLDHLIRVARLHRHGIAVGQSVEEELRDRGLDYIVAITESTEFGDVLPFLQKCEPEVVRPKLQAVLSGPILPTDEDTASNLSRNVLFELNLAARLERAGFEPVLGEHPDVACEVKGKRLYFACKRPFAGDRVPRLINRARKQLAADIGGHPGVRGVVAVSLSKVLNVGDRLFVFSTEAEGRRGLPEALTKAAARFGRAEKKLVGGKVVGIIYHVITPALNRELDMYYVAQQLEAHPFSPEGSADYAVFRALGRALEAAQY